MRRSPITPFTIRRLNGAKDPIFGTVATRCRKGHGSFTESAPWTHFFRPTVATAFLLLSVAAAAGFGRDRVELSDPGRFVIDPLRRGEQNGWQLPACDIQKWVDVEVPHCWNVDPRFPFSGMAWYRRIFSLPPETTKQHAILRFGGDFYRAKFWLHPL